MANTRQSAKRARQGDKRRAKNTIVRTATKNVLKDAIDAVAKGDTAALKEAYLEAVKTLSSAGTKGAIPKRRAARKISRLTLLIQKKVPELLSKSAK